MPLLQPRGRRPTTAATRSSTTARSSPRSGTMDDLRALAADLRARGMALCVDLVLNHTAREHPWARLAGRRPRARASTRLPRPHRARRLRARRCPTSSPTRAPGSSRWVDELEPLGLDDVQRLPVGPRLHEPRRVRWRWPRRCSGSPPSASTCCAWTPSPFLWKRLGTNCQNQPEVHELLQAFRARDADRRARRGVQGRGDRRAATTSSPTSGRARTRARSATSPTTTCSWCCCGARWRRGRVAAADRARCARCRRSRRGAGWLTYVRCHDDIGWAITPEDAARGRRGRRTCTGASWPTSTPGDFPGSLRARRALPARPAHRRGAHLRHAARRWPGSSAAPDEATPRSSSADPAHAAPVRGRLRARRAAADLHGRRARRCATTRPTSTTRARPTTTAGCTGRRWTGPPPRAATTRHRRGPRVRRGCERLVRRPAAALPALRAAGESAVLRRGNRRTCSPGGGGIRAAARFVGLVNFRAAPRRPSTPHASPGSARYVPVLTTDGPPELRADRVLLPGLGFAWYAEP